MGDEVLGWVRQSELASRLSLSTSSFAKLREAGRIGVDKTALIYTPACQQEKFFLTRPRRFGKSLLVSTLASLAGEGLRDFVGLAIESLWKGKPYSVVRLDFPDTKHFETFEEFRKALYDRLELAFAPQGFACDATSRLKFFSQWSVWLQEPPKSSLALLTNEGDAPLGVWLGEQELFKRVRKVLSSFCTEVKSHEAVFRFVFVTGVLKVGETGFWVDHDLTDISLNPWHGTLLGFAREEIQANFGSYFAEAQKTLGLSEAVLLDSMARHYDGDCFDRQTATHVFNPWLVMNFLQPPQAGFCNDWIHTGGRMAAWLECFKTPTLKHPAPFEAGKVISEAGLSAVANEKMISDRALLTQAGYLTIPKFQGGNSHLGCPNEAVATSMAAFYSELLQDGRLLDDVGADGVSNGLVRGTADEVAAEFNKAPGELNPPRYSVTDGAICRAFLPVLLYGAKRCACIEVHNAFGRSDQEVEAGSRRWGFELNFYQRKKARRTARRKPCLMRRADRFQAGMAANRGLGERSSFVQVGCFQKPSGSW